MHVSMVQLLLCTCTVRLLFIPGGHITRTDMGKKGVLPEIVEQSGDGGDSIDISRWGKPCLFPPSIPLVQVQYE